MLKKQNILILFFIIKYCMFRYPYNKYSGGHDILVKIMHQKMLVVAGQFGTDRVRQCRRGNAHLGRVRVVRHHVHAAEVDQVRPAAHADDASVQIRLALPRRLQRRQDLWVLRNQTRHACKHQLMQKLTITFITDQHDQLQ